MSLYESDASRWRGLEVMCALRWMNCSSLLIHGMRMWKRGWSSLTFTPIARCIRNRFRHSRIHSFWTRRIHSMSCAQQRRLIPPRTSLLHSSFFLRAVEMMDEPADESGNGSVAGAMTRAWYGVKLCVRPFLQNPKLSSPSNTPVPSKTHIPLLDELATERILAAYSSTSPAVRSKAKKQTSEKGTGAVGGSPVPAEVRGVVVKWLQGK